MDKFWLVLRKKADNQLELVADRPPDATRAAAAGAAGRLAAQDIKSRFVVMEAVACTEEPEVSVTMHDL